MKRYFYTSPLPLAIQTLAYHAGVGAEGQQGWWSHEEVLAYWCPLYRVARKGHEKVALLCHLWPSSPSCFVDDSLLALDRTFDCLALRVPTRMERLLIAQVESGVLRGAARQTGNHLPDRRGRGTLGWNSTSP